jgi:hypothetical protein
LSSLEESSGAREGLHALLLPGTNVTDAGLDLK